MQVKPTRDEDVKREIESSTAIEMTREQEQKSKMSKKDDDGGLPKIAKVVTAKAAAAQDGLQVAASAGSVVVNLSARQGTSKNAASSANAQLSGIMRDAPFCDQCGHVTVRNGACYKCLNCGNSMGCS